MDGEGVWLLTFGADCLKGGVWFFVVAVCPSPAAVGLCGVFAAWGCEGFVAVWACDFYAAFVEFVGVVVEGVFVAVVSGVLDCCHVWFMVVSLMISCFVVVCKC